MIAFLLANWKSLIAVAATGVFAYLLHAVDVNRLKADERAAVTAQRTVDGQQCDRQKQVTKEATDALQKDRNDIAAKLAAYKLQQPATCLPVTSSPNVHNRSKRPARPHGVNSDWLYDYAANQCSLYWRELKVCNQFIINERKIKQ